MSFSQIFLPPQTRIWIEPVGKIHWSRRDTPDKILAPRGFDPDVHFCARVVTTVTDGSADTGVQYDHVVLTCGVKLIDPPGHELLRRMWHSNSSDGAEIFFGFSQKQELSMFLHVFEIYLNFFSN